MVRSLGLFSILAGILVGLLAASRITSSAAIAQDATPAVQGQSVVGSWRVTVNDESGLTHPALITFAADGAATVSEPPLLPAPPGAPFQQIQFSGGNGVWASIDDDTAAITFDLLAADENGTPLGVFTVRGNLTLIADREQFDGLYDVVLTDPTGNVTPAGRGAFTGSRIGIEPMGTPTATTPQATPGA